MGELDLENVKKEIISALRSNITEFQNRVYHDYPRTDLSDSSFPRATVDVIGMRFESSALGGTKFSNLLLSITVYGLTALQVDQLISKVDKVMLSTEFSNFIIVSPANISPIIKDPERDRRWQRSIDYELLRVYNPEVV